jgi:hypothetical protein
LEALQGDRAQAGYAVQRDRLSEKGEQIFSFGVKKFSLCNVYINIGL